MFRRWWAAVAAAGLILAPGVAVADDGDGALCESQNVVVTNDDVAVMLEPATDAQQVFTVAAGRQLSCSAVEVGGEHDLCGAEGSTVWMIVSGFGSFDAYVPSHCVADMTD